MGLNLEISADGSHTLFSERFQEHYHSINGAIQESMHVFIHAGLEYSRNMGKTNIVVFETGFGTGLNALLACRFAEEYGLRIRYLTVEPHPVPVEVYQQLNYSKIINWERASEVFLQLHRCDWSTRNSVSEHFDFLKWPIGLEEISFDDESVDVIFHDAFSPDTQPELWSEMVFAKFFHALHPGGVLTTYSSKGSVKQALREAGFTVTRLKGPAGKRHILRAAKIRY